jgi:hypothetical protein
MKPIAIEPSGSCQRMAPVERSIAASVPQGGALHGMPSGESGVVRSAAYGVPRPRPISAFGSAARAAG